MMDVPLRQHAIGEPGSAAGVGDRPARAPRRGEPELGRRGRPDRTVDAQRLVTVYDGENWIGNVEVDRLDLGPGRGHLNFAIGNSEEEFAVHGGVDHDVYRHGLARYRGPGRPDVGVEPPALVDPQHDDARRNVVADHRADGLRPVARIRDRVEERAEQGEAGPPEEVRELLVAPIPPPLVEEPAGGSGRAPRLPWAASSAFSSPDSTWHLPHWSCRTAYLKVRAQASRACCWGPRPGPRVGGALARQKSPGLAQCPCGAKRGRKRMTTRRRSIITDSIKVGGTRSAECTPPLGQFDVPDDVAPGNFVPLG
jgi:hypothetical protein